VCVCAFVLFVFALLSLALSPLCHHPLLPWVCRSPCPRVRVQVLPPCRPVHTTTTTSSSILSSEVSKHALFPSPSTHQSPHTLPARSRVCVQIWPLRPLRCLCAALPIPCLFRVPSRSNITVYHPPLVLASIYLSRPHSHSLALCLLAHSTDMGVGKSCLLHQFTEKKCESLTLASCHLRASSCTE
jgi:hypothetical protein